MNERPSTGRIAVKLHQYTHKAEWRVVGDRVEVTSELGVDSAPLGPLRAAPGTVAREKLVEMAKRASRPERAAPDQPLLSMRDMMRWRP